MSDVVVFVIFVASLVGCVWACVSLGKAIYRKIKEKRNKPASDDAPLDK